MRKVFNQETGEYDFLPDEESPVRTETEEDRVKRELFEKVWAVKKVTVSLPEKVSEVTSPPVLSPSDVPTVQDKDSEPLAGRVAQTDHKRELNRKRVRKYRLEHGDDFKTYHANYMKNYRKTKKETK